MTRNRWTQEEIQIVLDNYGTKGVEHTTSLLKNHTRHSICKKANKLGLKVDLSIYHYDEAQIAQVVAESFNYKEVLNKLDKISSGDAYKCLIRYITKKNISTIHFDPWKHNRVNKPEVKLSDWLQIGTNIGSSKLKEKLYDAGLKQRQCELCPQGEMWNGKRMSLILDHKNGINNDNRIENLRIVCPNCNATLDTHCRGYKNKI